jgi:hypothetical protein
MMTHISSSPVAFRAFSAPYAPPDEALAAELLSAARLDDAQEKQIDATASTLISAIRARDSAFGGVEDLLHEYALSTPEGVALMMLAVPDDVTAGAGPKAGGTRPSAAFRAGADDLRQCRGGGRECQPHCRERGGRGRPLTIFPNNSFTGAAEARLCAISSPDRHV